MAKWTEQEIRQMLAQFVGVNKPTILGTVKDVDKDECTCTITDDGTDYPGVRLKPITGQNTGIVKYPKDDSFALAVKVESTEYWMIIEATEYKSILITVGSNKVEVSDSDIVFNDGEHGMVKISEMVTWMGKVYTDLQTLKGSLSTTVVAGNGAPLALVFSPSTPNPTISDFEDANLKH